jgi:hypothetical protein
MNAEQLNMALDIGILIVTLVNAFFLMKNSKKLKQLAERLEKYKEVK